MTDGVRGPGSGIGDPQAVWTRKRYLALLLAFAALHAILAMLLPVSGDEAYYWDCGRHFDWSYFDQPPLMLWTTRPFCLLLGDVRLAVRLPAIVASLMLGVFVLPLVRRLGGGAREAAWIYTALHAMPLFFLGSWYLSTDVGMMAAFVAAVWAAVAIAQGERRAWWGFGIAVGVGFLAKFSIALALAALVPALLRREARAHLRTPVPYLAALLSAAITLPVWVWAARHDWVNFTFQLSERHVFRPWTLRFLAQFLAVGALLASPPLAVAMAIAWWRAWRRRDVAWAAVLVAAVFPFLLFGAYSLREEVGEHWGGPGFVLGVVILGLTAPRPRRLIRAGAVVGVGLSAVMILVVAFVTYALDAEWSHFGHTRADWGGQLAAAVDNDAVVAEIERRIRPGEMMASESYTDVHLYALLSRGRLATRLAHVQGGHHGLASLYWYRPEELRGRDFLFVTERDGVAEPLGKIFAEVREEPPFTMGSGDHVFRRVRFYRCRDLLKPEGTFTRLAPAPPR